jgi:hypothetical protein
MRLLLDIIAWIVVGGCACGVLFLGVKYSLRFVERPLFYVLSVLYIISWIWILH